MFQMLLYMKLKGNSVLKKVYHSIASTDLASRDMKEVVCDGKSKDTYKYEEIEDKHQILHAAQTISFHGCTGYTIQLILQNTNNPLALPSLVDVAFLVSFFQAPVEFITQKVRISYLNEVG